MTIAPEPTVRTKRKKAEIDYPTGDGKPMAEDSLHRKQLRYATEALEFHFADRPDVYASGNDFLYYVEGDPRKRISPDCYVVIGVPKRRRRSYKVWEDNGVVPTVVFEFTSRKTRKEDEVEKRAIYEQTLGVEEYIQFDPDGDYLNPRLKGRRRRNGQYEEIPLNGDRMLSEALGLEMVIEGDRMRFYDPARQEWLYSLAEQGARARAEAQRANEEQRRAEAAEAEIARLRAELETLRSP